MATKVLQLQPGGLLERRSRMASGLRLNLSNFHSAPACPRETQFSREHKLKEILGSGTVATVRAATRVSDGKELAVKCIKSIDTEIRSFAKKEYEMLRSLDHPNIVRAHALYENAMTLWICMDLCAGGSLEQRVKKHGPLKNVLEVMRQLLNALSHLHAKRIVHRDIKPANLLLDSEDCLQIVDFNSAKCLGSKAAGLMLTDRGTQDFAAPELRFGLDWNERVDIWAAGLTLCFMLKGRLPFVAAEPGIKEQLLKGQLPTMDWDKVSVETRDLTEQCLAVDPNDRPPAMELCWHPAVAREHCGVTANESVPSEDVEAHCGSDNSKRLLEDAEVLRIRQPLLEPRTGSEAMRSLARAKCNRPRQFQHRAAQRCRSAFAKTRQEWD